MHRVAIIGGCRTPFVRAGGVFSKSSFLDLGIHAVTGAVKRLELDPKLIDELAFSTVLLDPRMPNAARELVLRSGLPKNIPAHFISNNCISGLVAISMIAEAIKTGRIKVGIAGGAESMSRPTLTLHKKAEAFYLSLFTARSMGAKLKVLSSFRPGMLLPRAPSPKEPSTGLTMGEHCEITTKEFEVARSRQDEIAFKSHQTAGAAQRAGFFAQEIEPYNGVSDDNLVRFDTSLEKLASLRPVFDRSAHGTLTAGNSSALTDGASAVCLMSEEEANRQGRKILGYLDDVVFSAIAPDDGLLMAPAVALPRLLNQHALSVSDVDVFEVHEAFAAQVAANIVAWEQGWDKYPDVKSIGSVPLDRINVNGGSIAIGHPFAATGGRQLLALVNQLQRAGQQTGVISTCAAGAMAAALLVRKE
ncbi:acetyl-CoA C-acyltransferase [Oligoflexia bacterium]|nr:acetyl-CoA C-acyltransferase [Oligoflexia bacterium]